MKQYFHIAIDGPVAAGKGTISKLISERLGFLYVDTGAMYRVASLLATQNNVSLDDVEKLATLIDNTEIRMHNPVDSQKDGRLITIMVNGEDVSWKIRTEEIAKGAANVGQISEVRKILVKKQQEISSNQNVVMEGRDISYRVLPDADLKIYLTGQSFVRAHRRHLQMQIRGIDITFNEVHDDLIARDKFDMERETDPLRIVDDAWVVDTTDLSIEQVVNLVVAKVQVMLGDRNEKQD